MRVLVAYASKHDGTRGIAERIAGTMTAAGLDVDTNPVEEVIKADGYDAFVIGSAVYYGSWMKEATEFVTRNQAILTARPVWLFSSGPISTEATDDEGRDLRDVSEPKQLAGLRESISPRSHRVFFGKLERGKLGFADRMITSLPAFPGSEGDFRDWEDIESWARSIARNLARTRVS